MRPDYFGEEVAARYDSDEAEMFDPAKVEPAVSFLAGLAGGGALEFGIGTGRLALPLAARGITVHGIDLSEAMVSRLRHKPAGSELPVTIGDFAITGAGRRFSLVYLVFNTIMNLTSQEDQVACFANAAAHLDPGGSFVIEVGVPQIQRLPPGERFRVFQLSPERLGVDEWEVAAQRLTSHHYRLNQGEFDLVSIPFRYVWPSELDLMARLAGLRLRQRWGDWDQRPFTDTSTKHVSVWEKPS
jgi:SAM-dependent methyltransferase